MQIQMHNVVKMTWNVTDFPNNRETGTGQFSTLDLLLTDKDGRTLKVVAFVSGTLENTRKILPLTSEEPVLESD